MPGRGIWIYKFKEETVADSEYRNGMIYIVLKKESSR